MPATKTELKNKEDFHGDLLDRQFSVRHDPKTGLYSYDYAELTPAVKTELDKIQFYRFSSPKLAEVEAEVAKLRKEPTTPPVVSPVKGEITKATEKIAEDYQKVYDEWAALYDKEHGGTPLTPTELARKKEVDKALVIYIRQAMATEAKQKLNAIENIRNEGIANANLTANQRALIAKEKQMTDIIDAQEFIEAMEEKMKAKIKLSDKEVKNLDEAEETLNKFPVVPPEYDFILQGYFQRKLYNSARAVKTQIEGTPETERTANQTRNYTKALANINAYEAANPNAKRAREEKELSMATALSKVSLKEYTNAKTKRNALQEKLNIGEDLTEEEQAEKTAADDIIRRYKEEYPNTNNNVPPPPAPVSRDQYMQAKNKVRIFARKEDRGNVLSEEEKAQKIAALKTIVRYERENPDANNGAPPPPGPITKNQWRAAKTQIQALIAKRNAGTALTPEEERSLEAARRTINAYLNTNPGPTREQVEAARARFRVLDNASNGRLLTAEEEREKTEARALIEEYEELHPDANWEGGRRRKRKTKKAKRKAKKAKKTRKH